MRQSIRTSFVPLCSFILMGAMFTSAQAQFSGNTQTTRQPAKQNFGNITLPTGPKSSRAFSNPSGGGKYLGRVEIPKPQPYQNNFYNNPSNEFNRGGLWPQRTQPQPQYDDYEYQEYQRPQRNYSNNRPYSQPSPSPSPAPASVAVSANAKPPEKIVAPKGNEAPFSTNLDPIDSESYALVGEMIEEQAHKSVDRLEEQLGDAADEPAVAAKITELREKIAAGERVTDQDIADLGTLVNQVDPAKFPANFDPNDLTESLDDIINMSEANELMQQDAYPDGGLLAGMPNGSVLMMPALPEDEMLLLPGGGMLMGTGGEGEIGLAPESAGEVLGINLGAGEPESDSDANVAKRVKSGTYIMNPNDSAADISYVVSNNNYTIKPGYTQLLPEGQTWVIRFDRGEKKGEAKYTLSEGTYMFGIADGAWELFKQSFSVTVDNADNESPFYVNIDNTQEEIDSRAKRTFTSEYPMLVRFDRGSGGEPAQKRITRKNADLIVAVNRVDGLWDLFPGENYRDIARKSSSKKSKVHQALLKEKLRLSLEGSR